MDQAFNLVNLSIFFPLLLLQLLAVKVLEVKVEFVKVFELEDDNDDEHDTKDGAYDKRLVILLNK